MQTRRQLPVLPCLLCSSSEWKALHAKSRSKGSQRIHLTRIRRSQRCVYKLHAWDRHQHQLSTWFTYHIIYPSRTFFTNYITSYSSLRNTGRYITTFQLFTTYSFKFTYWCEIIWIPSFKTHTFIFWPFCRALSSTFLRCKRNRHWSFFPFRHWIQFYLRYPQWWFVRKLVITRTFRTCWRSLVCTTLPAVSIHPSGNMTEDLLLSGQKNFWMAYPHLLHINNFKYKNPRKYIEDQISFALPYFNKEVSLAKNNLNSLAWKEPYSQQFVTQCSCYFVATPACKWGLDMFKYWAIAATSNHISKLEGQCSHRDHMDFRGKRLPDGSFVSALTAEYPSALASAIVNIISPWVSQSSLMNQDLLTWRSLLSKNPITRGPRITDGAGDNSSANWAIPQSKDHFKSLRQLWIKRILQTKLHTKIIDACKLHQSDPFLTDEDTLQDIQDTFASTTFDLSISLHQPFRLQLLHSLLLISEDPDTNIATLLQEGIPSGAFSQLQPVGLWEPNSKISTEYPDLIVCQDNWTSAHHDPVVTRQLIQKELDDGFIEEIPDIKTAELRWPKGIALGKLGVLDSTICGMNGRCHLPERQRLPNLRHISFFLSSCPPLQEEWQGASIDINAAHKRMLIREDERGSLLFKFDNRLFAYRSAHFGAKTSAWHWGRVSGALLRLLHTFLYFRHAAWVYVDDFFLLFPRSTSAVQFTLAIVLLRVIGTPLSWKKLEFDKTIDWNGWTIQPATMIAQLPTSKQEKISFLIDTVLKTPCRKNLEKIIGILLQYMGYIACSSRSFPSHFALSLYRDLYSIPATNYNSITPTQLEPFLNLLNDCATITTQKSAFISQSGHKLSNSNTLQFLLHLNSPGTRPSNATFGFASVIQIVTKDVYQTAPKTP